MCVRSVRMDSVLVLLGLVWRVLLLQDVLNVQLIMYVLNVQLAILLTQHPTPAQPANSHALLATQVAQPAQPVLPPTPQPPTQTASATHVQSPTVPHAHPQVSQSVQHVQQDIH